MDRRQRERRSPEGPVLSASLHHLVFRYQDQVSRRTVALSDNLKKSARLAAEEYPTAAVVVTISHCEVLARPPKVRVIDAC